MKNIIALLAIVIVGFGVYIFMQNSSKEGTATPSSVTTSTTTESQSNQASTTPNKAETVIGTSVEGRAITAYHYGTASDEVLFVGDIHGGYTPGTALLAYRAMDYFKGNADSIPSNVTVTI